MIRFRSRTRTAPSADLRLAPALLAFLLGSLALAPAVPAQWSPDPAVDNPLCTVTQHQYEPDIAPDGTGGAIVAWHDHRSSNLYPDIYAQRIDADGVVRWTAGGVVIAAEANVQQKVRIVSDGSGGAMLAWEDYRNGSHYAIWAQRIGPEAPPCGPRAAYASARTRAGSSTRGSSPTAPAAP